jgi:hypothetical protein
VTSNTDLGAALEAFILEHEYCGELDGGVEGNRVWTTCTCRAVINRNVDGD